MTPSQTDATTRQRIAKLMARVGLCSRRDAEAWIVDGRVSVNGEVLSSPAHDVGPGDAILVDGAPLPSVQKTRLFMFHKPRGLVTSDRDPEGRDTVADFLRANWPDGPRVVTIGRLDINTEGLLLLTNDGGLARMLELPKTGWVRRYRVRAKGETDQAVLDSLRDGVSIDGIDYAGIEATLDRTQGANVWLTMGLREGKNREVKRVLEHIGLEVNRLIRLSFGPFQLGDLAEGAVEEVRTRVLRDQLGAALAAAAGVAFEDAAVPPEAGSTRGDRKPRSRDGTATHGDDKPRTAGAERVNKGERSARAGGGARGRGGERPLRRPRDSEPLPPPPIRERPVAGARKHVSTLRAEESEAARRGPRRRIERSGVTDRHERSITVERRVAADPIARLAPTRVRGERPERAGRGGAPAHRQASPSALAKRARTARSGGYGTERENAAPRHGTPGRARPDGGKTFGDKRQRRDVAAGEPRPPRTSGGIGGDKPNRERPNSARPRGDRPRAAGGGRMPDGEESRERPGATPAHTQTDRPSMDARRNETRAPGGALRAGRLGGDGRRREAGPPSKRPGGDRPIQGKSRREEAASRGPAGGKPRGKRFDGERSGSRAERTRGEGRSTGAVPSRGGDGTRAHASRRPDGARPESARSTQRGLRSGGGKPPTRRGGSGGPKGAPRGGPSRSKPRPKG